MKNLYNSFGKDWFCKKSADFLWNEAPLHVERQLKTETAITTVTENKDQEQISREADARRQELDTYISNLPDSVQDSAGKLLAAKLADENFWKKFDKNDLLGLNAMEFKNFSKEVNSEISMLVITNEVDEIIADLNISAEQKKELADNYFGAVNAIINGVDDADFDDDFQLVYGKTMSRSVQNDFLVTDYTNPIGIKIDRNWLNGDHVFGKKDLHNLDVTKLVTMLNNNKSIIKYFSEQKGSFVDLRKNYANNLSLDGKPTEDGAIEKDEKAESFTGEAEYWAKKRAEKENPKTSQSQKVEVKKVGNSSFTGEAEYWASKRTEKTSTSSDVKPEEATEQNEIVDKFAWVDKYKKSAKNFVENEFSVFSEELKSAISNTPVNGIENLEYYNKVEGDKNMITVAKLQAYGKQNTSINLTGRNDGIDGLFGPKSREVKEQITGENFLAGIVPRMKEHRVDISEIEAQETTVDKINAWKKKFNLPEDGIWNEDVSKATDSFLAQHQRAQKIEPMTMKSLNYAEVTSNSPLPEPMIVQNNTHTVKEKNVVDAITEKNNLTFLERHNSDLSKIKDEDLKLATEKALMDFDSSDSLVETKRKGYVFQVEKQDGKVTQVYFRPKKSETYRKLGDDTDNQYAFNGKDFDKKIAFHDEDLLAGMP